MMADDLWDFDEDEAIGDGNSVDLLLNLLEEEDDNQPDSTPLANKSSGVIERKRKTSVASRDPSCAEAKRQKIEEDAVSEVSEIKAKMKEMEKELSKLKNQLKEKDVGNQITGKETRVVPVSFSKGKRVAHQTKQSGHSPPDRSKQQSVGVVKTKETPDNDCVTERFSGLRIKKALISQEVMSDRMRGRRMVKIPQIMGIVKDGDIEGDWVTIGTIVSKTHPRDTSKGKKFSVWRLSDLSSQLSSISFFLFDKVFQAHWKTPVGHVVAILNASIQTNKETNSSTGVSCNANKYSLSLDNPAKLMDLGVSHDFIICRATAKSGKQCQNFANKQHGGYCDYHVQKEYSKMRSTRMSCQGGYGPSTQNLQQKLLGRSEVFYGGQWHKGGGVASSKGKGERETKERMFAPGARKEMVEVEQLLGNDGGDLKRLRDGTIVQSGNEMLKELMKGQTPGALCLNSHLKKGKAEAEGLKEREKSALALLQEHSSMKKSQTREQSRIPSGANKDSSSRAKGPSLSKPKEFELFTPDNLLEDNQVKTEKPAGVVVVTPSIKKPPFSPVVKKKMVPQLGKPLNSVKADKHKEKALALVMEKGPLKRKDPNESLRGKTLDEKQQMEISRRLKESSDVVTTTTDKENDNELPDDEEFEKILNAKSSHDWVIQEEEREKQEIYFNSLEKKEQLEERLSQIKELTVRVVQCKECSYMSESVGSRCRKENHTITRLRATKRCFKCSGCGQRTYTYNERYPSQVCQCGDNKFQRCSIYKERSAPKLPSEELSLRGHEQKYLNSLK